MNPDHLAKAATPVEVLKKKVRKTPSSRLFRDIDFSGTSLAEHATKFLADMKTNKFNRWTERDVTRFISIAGQYQELVIRVMRGDHASIALQDTHHQLSTIAPSQTIDGTRAFRTILMEWLGKLYTCLDPKV